MPCSATTCAARASCALSSSATLAARSGLSPRGAVVLGELGELVMGEHRQLPPLLLDERSFGVAFCGLFGVLGTTESDAP